MFAALEPNLLTVQSAATVAILELNLLIAQSTQHTTKPSGNPSTLYQPLVPLAPSQQAAPDQSRNLTVPTQSQAPLAHWMLWDGRQQQPETS